jgi:Uma2 family endonuclease
MRFMGEQLSSVEAETAHLPEPHVLVWRGFTEADYFRLAPETRIAEFVDGDIYVNAPAGEPHQSTVTFLDRVLGTLIEQRGLGRLLLAPYTMRLRPGLCREPDLFFVAKVNEARILKSYLDGPADIAIEIISPSTRRVDLVDKLREYEEQGVGEYWLIDEPKGVVIIHERDETGRYVKREIRSGTVRSKRFPDIRLQAEWVLGRSFPNVIDCLIELLGPDLGRSRAQG